MSAELISQICKIASIILTAIVIVLSVITMLLKKSNNKKAQEIASKLEHATSGIITVKNVILEFMEQAEQFVNYTGNDKKSWVITKTKEYCIRNGIAYDDELIDSTLESLIEFSKRVNAPDEKKEEVAVEESTVTNVKSAGETQAPAEKEIKING